MKGLNKMTAFEKIFAISWVTAFVKDLRKHAEIDGIIKKEDVLSCKMEGISAVLKLTGGDELILHTIESVNGFFRAVEGNISEKGSISTDALNELYDIYFNLMAEDERAETESKEGAKE